MARLVAAMEGPGRLVIDVSSDPEHDRTVVSAVGNPGGIETGTLALAAAAVTLIDLRGHRGTHPRVGALDVVPIVPLGDATIEDAVLAAVSIGRRLNSDLGLPVFFYGDASPSRTRLADIRAGRVQPSLGGHGTHPTAGAVCVGARPLMVAFNVDLPAASPDQARALARVVRAHLGAMGVQALGFPRSAGAQLSMNLLDPLRVPPARVLAELGPLARRAGLRVGRAEVVGLCPEAASAGVGQSRVLERRMAAAATTAAAIRLAQRGDEEARLVAERILAQVDGVLSTEVGPEGTLGTAELCLGIGRVLAAAGLAPGLEQPLLRIAGEGLRRALPAPLDDHLLPRVKALDRLLDLDRIQDRPMLD